MIGNNDGRVCGFCQAELSESGARHSHVCAGTLAAEARIALERLGIVQESGELRQNGRAVSSEEATRLVNLLRRGENTHLAGSIASRAFVTGMHIIEVESLAKACLERLTSGEPARLGGAFTVFPDGRLAVVQGDSRGVPKGEPGHLPGFIAWWEHEAAWHDYGRRHNQSAEVIHQRGGFGYLELVGHLGRAPLTWRPR